MFYGCSVQPLLYSAVIAGLRPSFAPPAPPQLPGAANPPHSPRAVTQLQRSRLLIYRPSRSQHPDMLHACLEAHGVARTTSWRSHLPPLPCLTRPAGYIPASSARHRRGGNHQAQGCRDQHCSRRAPDAQQEVICSAAGATAFQFNVADKAATSLPVSPPPRPMLPAPRPACRRSRGSVRPRSSS